MSGEKQNETNSFEEHYFLTEDEYFDPGAHMPIIAVLSKLFPPGVSSVLPPRATRVSAFLKSFRLQLYLPMKLIQLSDYCFAQTQFIRPN